MDRRPVLGGDSWGPKAHCIRWASRSPYGEARGQNFANCENGNIVRIQIDAAFAELLWPLTIVIVIDLSAYKTVREALAA